MNSSDEQEESNLSWSNGTETTPVANSGNQLSINRDTPTIENANAQASTGRIESNDAIPLRNRLGSSSSRPSIWGPILLEDYDSSGEEGETANAFTEEVVIQSTIRGHLRQQSLDRQAIMDQLWAAPDNEEEQEVEAEMDENEEEDDLETTGTISVGQSPERARIAWSAAEISATERIDDTANIRQRIQEISRRYDNEKIHLSYQPGFPYNDPVDLRYCGAQNLDILEFPSYRNNLAVASKLQGVLFLADGSVVRMYKVDEPSQVLESSSVFSFDTKPDSTTMNMRVGANWSNFPHFINHMITGIMGGIEYLVTAADNGRVLIFEVPTLVRSYINALKLNETKSSDSRTPVQGKISPLCVFQMPASAWGLCIHEQLQLLAVSCNTARVTILNLKEYLAGTSKTVLRYVSPGLRHNIPDVSFIYPTAEDVAKGLYTEDAFYVACTSISGDLVLWEFFTGKRLDAFYQEASDKNLKMFNTVTHLLGSDIPNESMVMNLPGEPLDPQFLRVPFEGGRWLTLRNIDEEGWTINTVCEKDFKNVESFYELSGSEWLNENNVFRQLSVPLHTKYVIPGLNRDKSGQTIPLNQNFFDFGMRFIHFSISTTSVHHFDLQSHLDGHRPFRIDLRTLPLDKVRQTITDHYISSRNKCGAKPSGFEPSYTQRLLQSPPLNNQFVILTSRKSLYLCRAESFLCNGSVPDVFHRGVYVSGDSAMLDRMNMVKVIPGLSAVVIASQLGSIAVFRLVRYKSLFTMRQEYVFPVHEMLIHRTPVIRSIMGLTVTPIFESDQNPVTTDPHAVRTHRLTVLYKDGFVLTYNISRLDQNKVNELIF